MKRLLKVSVLFVSFVFLYINISCSPPDPVVGSPGGGDNWQFTIVSGNNQSVPLHDTLQNRMVVKLAQVNGTALRNESIRFYLVAGSGQVQKPIAINGTLDLVTPTDASGMATAQFLNFGGDPVTGISQIRAEVVDSTQFNVLFTINSSP